MSFFLLFSFFPSIFVFIFLFAPFFGSTYRIIRIILDNIEVPCHFGRSVEKEPEPAPTPGSKLGWSLGRVTFLADSTSTKWCRDTNFILFLFNFLFPLLPVIHLAWFDSSIVK